MPLYFPDLILSARGETVAPTDELSKNDIEPKHVYAQVALVRAELELIRLEMGKPEAQHHEMRVSGAAPREVYAQAETLFRKADRLCYERLGLRSRAPAPPEKEIRPGDVLGVVKAANQRIQLVKEKLGIPEQGKAPSPNGEKLPSDVFLSIVQANRQLNLLPSALRPRILVIRLHNQSCYWSGLDRCR